MRQADFNSSKYNLFLALMYCATDKGLISIDLPRNLIAVCFFKGFASFLNQEASSLDGAAKIPKLLDNPYVNWLEANAWLEAFEKRFNFRSYLTQDILDLIQFRKREYIGASESEIWYESDFEGFLREINKTPGMAFSLSVGNAKNAELYLGGLSDYLRPVVEKIGRLASEEIKNYKEG